MSDQRPADPRDRQGWWLASDGNWYPPEQHRDYPGGWPEPAGDSPSSPASGTDGPWTRRVKKTLGTVGALALIIGFFGYKAIVDEREREAARADGERLCEILGTCANDVPGGDTAGSVPGPSPSGPQIYYLPLTPEGEAIAAEWADEFVRDGAFDGLPLSWDEAYCMTKFYVDALGEDRAQFGMRVDHSYLGSAAQPDVTYSDDDARGLARAVTCLRDPAGYWASLIRLIPGGDTLTLSQIRCVADNLVDVQEQLEYLSLVDQMDDFHQQISAASEPCGVRF